MTDPVDFKALLDSLIAEIGAGVAYNFEHPGWDWEANLPTEQDYPKTVAKAVEKIREGRERIARLRELSDDLNWMTNRAYDTGPSSA